MSRHGSPTVLRVDPSELTILLLRRRIAAMFDHYVPSKSHRLPIAFARYEGREELLLRSLIHKFGPEPPLPPMPQLPTTTTTTTMSSSVDLSPQLAVFRLSPRHHLRISCQSSQNNHSSSKGNGEQSQKMDEEDEDEREITDSLDRPHKEDATRVLCIIILRPETAQTRKSQQRHEMECSSSDQTPTVAAAVLVVLPGSTSAM